MDSVELRRIQDFIWDIANVLRDEQLGWDEFGDHNAFHQQVDAALDVLGLALKPFDKKLILRAVSWRDESAPAVIASRKLKRETEGLLQSILGATA